MASLKDLTFEVTLKPIIKLKKEEPEDIEVTKTPFNLRGSINIINKSENRRIIAGYANVAVVDLQDQFIPVETLKKGIESLLEDPHYSNLMLVHQNIQIGKIIPKFEQLETHVDDKGLFIVAEVRKDIETANEIWQAILDNEINGFSIGCEVISSHKKCDDEDKCITILDEINIFEVSVCTSPVNDKSGFIVVSKSQKEYVCDECKIDIENMSKKDETQEDMIKTEKTEETKENKEEEKTEKVEQTEEKAETEELSIEERIASIEREISAMSEIIQSLSKKDDEDDETCEKKSNEEIVEETKEEKAELEEKEIPKKKESEDEEEEEDSYKKSFDEIIEKLNNAIDKLTEINKSEELKLSIMARDDQIKGLKKQVEVLTKSKDNEVKEETKPKTVQDDPEVVQLEQDSPIKVERGLVYYEE